MPDPYAGLGAPPGGSNSPTQQTPSDPYAGLGSAPSQVRAPAATGLGVIGQTFHDLTTTGPANHDPNALESGIMSVANSKPIQGMVGSYQSADQQGFGGLVARGGEALNDMGVDAYGALTKIKAAYPGQSDQFYKDHLHQIYNQAQISSRQDASQQVQQNSYPGSGVVNFPASVAGSVDPSWLYNPAGGVGKALGLDVGKTALSRVAGNVATHAVINSGLDDAYQAADMLTGVQKGYDLERNLSAAAMGGAFGGAHAAVGEVGPHVSDFVKGLFADRNTDTTPAVNPTGRTTPLTGGQPTPEVAGQIHNAWNSGNEQDIFNSYKDTNITPPSHADIHEFVKNRDNPEAAPQNPPPLGEVDQRQAVQEHIQNLTKDWKNAPDFEVINHIGDIEDPQMVAHALDQNADHPDVLGFHGPDGKVRIFANKIDSPETLNALVYHEALGHNGLQQTFGDRLDATLNTLATRNVGQFGRDVDNWQKNNPGAYGGDRTRAAEEVLAEMSQNGRVKPVLMDAVTSLVRNTGRKMGMKLSYSDAEVRNILSMAHDSVINGNGRNVPANGFKVNHDYQPTDLNEQEPVQHVSENDGFAKSPTEDHIAGPYSTIGVDRDSVGGHVPAAEPYTPRPEAEGDGFAKGGAVDAYSSIGATDDSGERLNFMKKSQLNDKEGFKPLFFHGGGDFDEINPSRFGSGEPGDIRPLGQGLHGGVAIRPEDVPTAIELAKVYTKYGGNSPTVHAFHVELPDKVVDNVGYKPGEWARTGDQLTHELEALPWKPREGMPTAVEGSIKDPSLLSRVGKWTADTPSEKILSDLKSSLSFMNRSQLAASKDFVSDDLDRIYHSLDEHYTPTTQTWDETRRSALDLGFKPSQIKEMGGTEGLAVKLARIQAAANMAQIKLSDLNERLGTPDWKMADQMAYIQTLADSHYLNARVKGTRSDIARALNVSKAARSYSNATMAEVAERLKAEGSGLATLADDPIKFMTFAQGIKNLMKGGNQAAANIKIAGVDKPYWERYLSSFHFNAMLSALSTHVKAPLDMMTGISHNVIDHAIAVPIGKLYNAAEMMTSQTVRPGVSSTEVAGRLWGAIRSVFAHEVYVKTLHAAATGEGSVVLPNGTSRLTNPAAAYGASGNPRIPGVSIPTDLITAQDTFFRSHAISQELYGLGTRQAIADFKRAGINPSMDDIMTAGAANAHNPNQTMLQQAMNAGEKSLLLNPNKLTGWLDKARAYRPGMTPLERLGTFAAQNLAPFMRVASNSLLTRTIERSPLPLLAPSTWRTLAAGGADAHMALAKMTYGTIKLGLMWGAADTAKNLITGSGPDNNSKFKEQEAGGWRPDAVHKNGQYNTGGTLNMSLNPFDPHNSTQQMVKDMRTAYEEGANKGQVGVGLALALGSVLHSFESSSWIHDVAPALGAADARGEDAGHQLAQFVGDEAKTFVPAGLNQINRTMIDPNQRDTRPDSDNVPGQIAGQVVNSVKSAIPGLSQTLPVKYSVYGDPMPTGASATGVHTVVPGLQGNSVNETTDPTKMELERLASLTPAAVITPVQRTVQVTDTETGDKKPMKLTSAQFEQYQQLAGVNIVDQVRQLMATPGWAQTPDKVKIAAVREVQTEVKKAAREQLFGQ